MEIIPKLSHIFLAPPTLKHFFCSQLSPQLPPSPLEGGIEAHGRACNSICPRKGRRVGRIGTLQVVKLHILSGDHLSNFSCYLFPHPRNCLLHVAVLHQEGLISGETAFNCVIILQVGYILVAADHLLDIDLQETAREAPSAMVENWLESRELVLQQQEAVNKAGRSEILQTPVKRHRGNPCEGGLEVPSDQGLEVLTELASPHSKEEGFVSGEGERRDCDFGEGVLDVLKNLGERGVKVLDDLGEGGAEILQDLVEGEEGLKVVTEVLNSLEVFKGEGESAKRDVVEVYTILDKVGGEIEMFHISDLKDDIGRGEVGGEESSEVEIVIQNEPEGELAQEWLEFEVEPKPGKEKFVYIVPGFDVKRKKKHTGTSRESFLKLRK